MENRFKYHMQSALLLLGCLSASAAYLAADYRADQQRIAQALGQRAADTQAALLRTLNAYEYGLRGARGALVSIGEDELRRFRFHNYFLSTDLAEELPGAAGFGVIRRVAADAADDFTAQARRDGATEFTLHPPLRGVPHMVVQYLEPERDNADMLGLDIAADAQRRQAAERAAVSGQATLSGPQSQPLLFLLPVYRSGSTPPQAAGRVSETWAWVFAPLRLSAMLRAHGLLQDDTPLTLRDLDAGAQPFFDAGRAGAALVPGLQAARSFEVYGRRWELALHGSQAFYAAQRPLDLWTRGATLAALSLCLSLAFWLWRQSAARRQLFLAERSRLGAIVESSLDAIIGKDLQGRVTSWNPAAALLFGYRSEEVMGRNVAPLLIPPDRQQEEALILEAARAGRSFEIADTVRLRKDGSPVPVSVSVAVIRDDSGEVVGASSTMRDITQQKSAASRLVSANAALEQQDRLRAEELARARRQLQAVLDGVPSMIGYWDRNLVNQVANHAYHSWYGVSPDALPGTPMRALLGEQVFQEVLPYAKAALRGEPQTFERRFAGPDGRARDVLAHYLPDWVNGQVAGFYVVGHDVTEQVRSQRKLQDALAENRTVLETISRQMLYTILDEQGVILDANERTCALQETSREQLLGQRFQVFEAGKGEQDQWPLIQPGVRNGEAWRGERCLRTPSGRLAWLDTVIAPLPAIRNAGMRYVALSVDITERKNAAAEIVRLHNLLAGVLKSATEVSIIATDREGVIEVFNSGAERMLGYRADELIGRATPMLWHLEEEVAARAAELSQGQPQAVSGFRTFIAMALERGAETRIWTFRRKDGSTFPMSLTVTAIRDEAGRVAGFLGIGFDVSKQHEVEQSLRLAKNMAEQASRSKSQFVANMSHEIRTPMNAVLGLLQVLARTRLDPEQQDYVNKASRAGVALLGLINDVLDYSKLEADHLILDPHPFALDAMLQEAAIAAAGARERMPLELVIDASPRIPQQLVGDNLRLRQVLVNLLSNAIKFTAQGHVLLRVECRRRENGRALLRFSVSDTGIGIADSQREQVFGEFTQAESSTTRRFGGTGLGLAISRRLVALMGGTLQLDSTVNVGSCFWFEVDLLEVPQPEAAPMQHGRVLLLAGHAVTRDMLARLLPELGWLPDLADDGAHLLALASQAAQAGRPYRLAVIDASLQGKPGLAVAQALQRIDAALRPRVLMLAAHEGEVARAPELVQQVLNKPFTAAQLAAALEVVQRAAPAAPQPQAPQPVAQRLAGMHILVVEDQPINRQVAQSLLEYEGATVLLADGGASGVAIANRHCRELDVILMDLQMPDMDGFAAAKAIQSNPATANIPIIAMTANASVMDRKACLQAGMVDHIGKPIDIDNVVAVLTSHIGQALAQPLARTSAPPAAPADDALEALEQVMQRFGHSMEVYEMALQGFAQAGTEILDGLEAHCAAGDAAQAAGDLHALKGVASTLGASGLAARCAALEQALKQGTAIDAACGAAQRQGLRDALAQSAHALLQRLPGAQAPAALQGWLDEVGTLLDFGSLDAIDKLEQVLPQLDEALRSDASAVLDAVMQLQFEQASTQLARLARALEAA